MPPTTTTTTKSTTEIILPPPIMTTRRPRRNKNRRKNRNKRPKEQLQFEQTVEKKDQNGRVIEEVNHISFVINEEKGSYEINQGAWIYRTTIGYQMVVLLSFVIIL